MKLPKIILYLVVGVGMLTSCGEKPHENEQDDDGVHEEIDEPRIVISVQEADSLFVNYGNDRADILEEAVNGQNDLPEPYVATRFLTVDYKELQAYLKFIDQESKKAGVTPTGLRIYFGKEPSAIDTGDNVQFRPGAETVFLNPVTSFDGIEGDISYAINTSPTGEVTAVTVGSVIDAKRKPQGKGNLLLIQENPPQSLASDTFEMPPPPIAGDPNDYH